jgi:predicted glycoside hydrolase/deacetylase ChbG (UPF0249 family)
MTNADRAGLPEQPLPAYLIVNADDYGYSEGVSRGILEAAREGVVTATGILANSPRFDDHARELLAVDRVDAGVHLDLTAGPPLTSRLASALSGSNAGSPPGKARVALSVLSGRIAPDAVEEEWDAQIRRCLEAGIRVRFLNSHEHLHMLPPLLRVARRLARRHGIPHVRRCVPEWFGFRGGVARDAVLQILAWIDRDGARTASPVLLGVSRSGNLDLPYLEKRMSTLRGGRVYELMCHPGSVVAGEAIPPRLRAYHNWEGELAALVTAERKGLFRSPRVLRVGFRDLAGEGPGEHGPGEIS